MKEMSIIIVLLILPFSVFGRGTSLQGYLGASTDLKQAIIAKSVESRTELVQSIQKKYSFIPHVWSLIPTYDITSKYHPYLQKYSLSCEIAAAKMVMESLGTKVSEDDIFYRIPTFSGSYESGGIWGDPDKEFVGDPKGSQYKKTGYGVYEKPLSSYLNERGFDTEIINATSYAAGMSAHRHLIKLLETIQNNSSRVILWGDWCTTPSLDDGVVDKYNKNLIKIFPISARNTCDRSSDNRAFSWNTEDGNHVNGISGEHAFLLLGYIGNINHPTHIIVWDTSTGRHIFPYDEWMRKWSLLQFRSLIVREK